MPQLSESISSKTKWIFIIFGLINLLIASYHFWFATETPGWGLLQLIVLIVAGPLALLFGLLDVAKVDN